MNYTSPLWKIVRGLCLLAVLAAALAGLYLIFGKMPDAERSKLLLEASKALFQIITALIVGIFISAVVKSFANSRKADKALHDFRLEFLNQLQAAYQRVKKSRRALRASGLTTKFDAPPLTMSQDQRDNYRKEMDVLNEAQLELERLNLEIGHFPDSFSGHQQLTLALGNMESYLRDILTEYEKFWPKLKKEAGDVRFAELPMLNDFTGRYSQSKFKGQFARSYDVALALIRQELLPLNRAAKAEGDGRSLPEPPYKLTA